MWEVLGNLVYRQNQQEQKPTMGRRRGRNQKLKWRKKRRKLK